MKKCKRCKALLAEQPVDRGKLIFHLYDTHGMPPELGAQIATTWIAELAKNGVKDVGVKGD